MTLRLNGSTSGYVEIDAPATAGSNTLVLPTGNGTNGQYLQTNGSGSLSWANAGKILQVVSTTKTDVFSSSSSSFVDVTGLSVNITPSSTSSKILIIAALTQSNSGSTVIANLVRNSTTLAQPDGSPTVGGTVNLTVNSTDLASSSIINFLDSPSTTSSTTYKIQVRRESSGVTFYINRRNDSANHAYVSTITAMEVAG